ncbi:MAG: cell division/cell wall cluster transcriptional repressor MraZ [Alphaproteobacteria bacterium RIFCSPLOWO2_01_FULL_40_26]|nr:MAG: cell division/cell wall cluster transcriptional repressor MraZ [Alphaproteobacteria bacterium RIFCSPHIGHO2_02_FULL_40_34]OFW94267.1 MAG: cell division/cell wall cluster transcriptional repressor MraZ [Alphaproteobacteria bacterium RIFCSPLOWO2_01_FULL_40_26]OFX09836.1 MAG: cell division/cell wall cluster transcriptional repressor MraZ [Alphaproteobacteria bacterium RIFCSPLOWO2_02_FULL_40_19]OFX11419.1 MAG: cell division/cell wall cluster transcriptional repressor MraZ [Alphaproteobacteria
MALFLSTFANKIDAKGRVSVPAQFRASLVNESFSGMVVYESFINDCIEGCDIERIKKLSESIDNLDPFSEERDAFATAVLGGSMQLSIDGDGRVIMPENLLKKVKIKNDLIFVGKGSTFEIWEPKKFNEYMLKAKKDAKTKRNVLKATK